MVLLKQDELYHHGILGMKWGQRRYQYEDGTLTPEGILRYRKAQDANDRSWNEKREAARNGKKLSPIQKAKYRISNVNLSRSLSGKKEESTEWMTSQRYGSKSVPSEKRFEEMVQKYADRHMSELQKYYGDEPFDIPKGLEKYVTPEMLSRVREGFEEEGRKKLKELFPEYDKTPFMVSDEKGDVYYREEGGENYKRGIFEIEPDKDPVGPMYITIETQNGQVSKKTFDYARHAEKLLRDKMFESKIKNFIVDKEAEWEKKNGKGEPDEEYKEKLYMWLPDLGDAKVVQNWDSILFTLGYYDVEYDPKTKKFRELSYND